MPPDLGAGSIQQCKDRLDVATVEADRIFRITSELLQEPSVVNNEPSPLQQRSGPANESVHLRE